MSRLYRELNILILSKAAKKKAKEIGLKSRVKIDSDVSYWQQWLKPPSKRRQVIWVHGPRKGPPPPSDSPQSNPLGFVKYLPTIQTLAVKQEIVVNNIGLIDTEDYVTIKGFIGRRKRNSLNKSFVGLDSTLTTRVDKDTTVDVGVTFDNSYGFGVSAGSSKRLDKRTTASYMCNLDLFTLTPRINLKLDRRISESWSTGVEGDVRMKSDLAKVYLAREKDNGKMKISVLSGTYGAVSSNHIYGASVSFQKKYGDDERWSTKVKVAVDDQDLHSEITFGGKVGLLNEFYTGLGSACEVCLSRLVCVEECWVSPFLFVYPTASNTTPV